MDAYAQAPVSPDNPNIEVVPAKSTVTVSFSDSAKMDSGQTENDNQIGENQGGQVSDKQTTTVASPTDGITDTAEVKQVANSGVSLPDTGEDTQKAATISVLGLSMLIALALMGLQHLRTDKNK
ncbi:hypothetical protein IV68_GL001242 [Weissella halotolerans DSM 20190]|uniref:Gram-positive cocci surface proteins LPxTG domain-containing protein n=1 Tax=Weissella halotolerans DSM 20190 TaxID=1123500 RepID=A0A0R2FQL3_9LACO|nr:hypothetical protein IV68_GL001242 [Weissella halotolerans DSM 20190]